MPTNNIDELIIHLRRRFEIQAADAIESQQKRIDELNASRIAYANEFPLDANGCPDVGSIHQNIRSLKDKLYAIRQAVESASELASGTNCVIEIKAILDTVKDAPAQQPEQPIKFAQYKALTEAGKVVQKETSENLAKIKQPAISDDMLLVYQKGFADGKASASAQVPEGFTEWLCHEMPEGTVIGNPKWWADRITRAMLNQSAPNK